MTDEHGQPTVNDTLVVKPPKYQVTIGQAVRETLGIDGKKASLNVEITLNRIIEDESES
jgi:hypothetical protein